MATLHHHSALAQQKVRTSFLRCKISTTNTYILRVKNVDQTDHAIRVHECSNCAAPVKAMLVLASITRKRNTKRKFPAHAYIRVDGDDAGTARLDHVANSFHAGTIEIVVVCSMFKKFIL